VIMLEFNAEAILNSGMSDSEAHSIISVIRAASSSENASEKEKIAFSLLQSLSGEREVNLSMLLRHFDIETIMLCMRLSIKIDIRELYNLAPCQWAQRNETNVLCEKNTL